MTKQKINSKLLPVKVHYFLVNGALSGVIPVLTIHAYQLGISAVSIGIIYTVTRLVTVFGKLVFGIIVDRFKNYKRMLFLLLLCVLGTMTGICYLPIIQQFTCSNHASLLVFTDRESCCSWNCSQINSNPEHFLVKNEADLKHHFKSNAIVKFEQFHFPRGCVNISGSYRCAMKCNNYTTCEHSKKKITSMTTLYLFAVLLVVSCTSYAVVTTLSDAACYNMLGNNMHQFGNQRMFGSIGWMIFSILAGVLNNVIIKQFDLNKYSSGFYIMMILIPIDLIVIGKLDLSKVERTNNILKDVGKLIFRLRIICFLISVFLNGAFIGLVWSFLFLHLESLGANPLLLGLASMISCAAEIPFFRFSGIVIRKIGHLHTISMASIALGIRFLGYAYLKDPWWAIPLELLHGPGFAGFHAASTSYAKFVAPEGTAATMQGLVGAAFEGLGVGAGGLLGGISFGYFGGSNMFFWASITAFITGTTHTIVHKILDLTLDSPASDLSNNNENEEPE